MVQLLPPALEREEREEHTRTNGRDLVLAIRASKDAGDGERVQGLCEQLLAAAQPMFLSRAQGLRDHPVLYEEVLANMCEHLLREALDTRELFITQNFPHFLRCLAQEEFTRLLRQEGMRAWDGKRPQRSGRPMQVPRALMLPMPGVPAAEDTSGEEPPAQGEPNLPDPHDPYEEFHAGAEAGRILSYLRDPLDRRIVCLRVLEGMKWDEVAPLCGKTERTVRLRFARALAFLRVCLEHEQREDPPLDPAEASGSR